MKLRRTLSVFVLAASFYVGMTAPVIQDQASANASVNVSKRSAEDMALGFVSRTLKDRGFYNGPETDVLTPRLEEAVMLFQQAAGLEPDGLVTPDLMVHLSSKTELRVTAAGADPIRVAPKDEVRFVRSALSERGFAVQTETAKHNRVDQSMRSAITAFQEQNGLPVDGRITTSLLAQMTKASY